MQAATPTARLRIQCLGPLRVWREGQELAPSDFKRRKARELLALFITHAGSACARDFLMETLWPESTQKAAVRDFRVALHALSDALEPERPKNTTAGCIERRDDVYTFVADEATWLDLAEFESLAERGLRSSEPEESVSLLARALKLYGGEFLEDYPYLDWCAPTRQRLRQAYLEASDKLARLHFEAGRDEEAAQVAHAILETDRCWEEAYRVLMRVHMRNGRAFMVTRLYEQCSQALDEDLGLLPGDDTEVLYLEATEG